MTKQRPDRPVRQKISLRNITTKTDVFQFRHFQVDPHHVDALKAVLDNGNVLDPLTLWQAPESGELVVIDGHHRLAAYRKAEWRKKVPALVYGCTLEQARLLALRENVKTRLPLTKDERMDAAWALVCLNLPEYSKRVIRETTGVGDGTVANMRRTRETLIKREPDDSLPPHWWQALATLKDREKREYTEDEREAMIEAKKAKLDAEIGKQLGFMAANQPEAACEVVAKRLGRQGLSMLFEQYIRGTDLCPMYDDDLSEGF